MVVQIVAFGDCSARLFGGEGGPAGPLQTWPARLEEMLRERGVNAQVKNESHSGEQIDFAMEKFGEVTRGAALCILGFGADDILRPEVSLGEFLSEISDVLDQAAQEHIPIILLGIPWFSEQSAGEMLQTRLPLWNESLSSLCNQLEVPFVDLYRAFLGDCEPDTPKHHRFAAAQERVAELLLPLALAVLEKKK